MRCSIVGCIASLRRHGSFQMVGSGRYRAEQVRSSLSRRTTNRAREQRPPRTCVDTQTSRLNCVVATLLEPEWTDSAIV